MQHYQQAVYTHKFSTNNTYAPRHITFIFLQYHSTAFLLFTFSLHRRSGHPSAKGGRFAEAFHASAPARVAHHVRHRREGHVGIELTTCEDASIFKEIAESGYVDRSPAAKYAATYLDQVKNGADAVLSVCSSVADIAYAMQGTAAFLGVPLIDINEEMCREAVRKGRKITVAATFPSAIGPIGRTLERIAREMGRRVEIQTVLIDGGFGLDKKAFKSLMAKELKEPAESSDVIIFAQSSMAYCADYIKELYGKEVLSNPKFGAKAVKIALCKKGLMQ